jgi:hypothetical protein
MSNYYLKDSKFNLHRPKQKKWLGRFFNFNKFLHYGSNLGSKVYKRHVIVIAIAVVIIIIGLFFVVF